MLNVAKKLGICDQKSGDLPLSARQFYNAKSGVRSIVMRVAKKIDDENSVEKAGTKGNSCRNKLSRCHDSLIGFVPQKISKIGPKVFLDISKKR